MRPVLILSGAALLSLAAVSAHAQATSNPSASPPSAVAQSRHNDRGYDARAKKHTAPEADHSKSTTPGFAQTSKHHEGNNAGYLVPFGPPA